MVSLSNHERMALRQAQGQRGTYPSIQVWRPTNTKVAVWGGGKIGAVSGETSLQISMGGSRISDLGQVAGGSRGRLAHSWPTVSVEARSAISASIRSRVLRRYIEARSPSLFVEGGPGARGKSAHRRLRRPPSVASIPGLPGAGCLTRMRGSWPVASSTGAHRPGCSRRRCLPAGCNSGLPSGERYCRWPCPSHCDTRKVLPRGDCPPLRDRT